MALSQVGAIVADRLVLPVSTMARIEQELNLPDDPAHYVDNATLLILAALLPGQPESVVPLVDRYAQLYDEDEGRWTKAAPFISTMLDALVELDPTFGFATKSIVSLHKVGRRIAVSVTIPTDTGHEQITFTDDGGEIEQNRAAGIAESRSVSGKTLFWIARDLAEIVPPIVERRTFPLKVVQ